MRTVYFPLYILRPFERGIQETLGKYSGFVMPGLGFQIPLLGSLPVTMTPAENNGHAASVFSGARVHSLEGKP